MFIIKCTNCGREQEWKTGTEVRWTAIMFGGDRVVCDCGSMVQFDEKDWVLHEGKVED